MKTILSVVVYEVKWSDSLKLSIIVLEMKPEQYLYQDKSHIEPQTVVPLKGEGRVSRVVPNQDQRQGWAWQDQVNQVDVPQWEWQTAALDSEATDYPNATDDGVHVQEDGR